jgi:hypothetical protein
MNKREFVASGVAAVVAAPVLGQAVDGTVPRASLQGLLARIRRLPDLAERAGADAFSAYVGERFSVAAGPGAGEQLLVTAVDRLAGGPATEQFDVRFVRITASGMAAAAGDGVRLLAHATGQRIALHLERGADGYAARFNLLA